MLTQSKNQQNYINIKQVVAVYIHTKQEPAKLHEHHAGSSKVYDPPPKVITSQSYVIIF